MPNHAKPQPIDPARIASVLTDLNDFGTTEVAELLAMVMDGQMIFLDETPDDIEEAEGWRAYAIAVDWRRTLRYVFERKFFAVN